MKNFGFVKCAIATFNGRLANPKYNATKIKELIGELTAEKVKILVLPELSLTGYTCQDFFTTTDLLESSLDALKEICNYTKSCLVCSDTLVLVGCPLRIDDALYNCAVAIQAGKILGVVPKQYLPNSNEFYEKRWFTPYTDFSCKEIDVFGDGTKVPFGNIIFSSSLGYKLGVEICEDLWSVIPPSSYLALAGANIIANLSASNELVGKANYRRELIKNQSARTVSAYLYVSANCFSESTSDLVFGGSGYAFENGKELVSLERLDMKEEIKIFDADIEYISNQRIKNTTFSDSKRNLNCDFTIVDFYQESEECIKEVCRNIDPHPFIPNIMDETGGRTCKEILSIQAMGLARRLSTINNSKVTIGVSGGLDSTLALLVCYEAFSKLGLDPRGIIAITMPGFGTTDRTFNNSVELCKKLGVTLKEIPIRDACIQHFKDIDHNPEVHDITYENSQARERTKILMDMANKHHGILVGTGDLSELVLGWCTYNGDHMSMYNVNSSIPKTLVKYLIEWYARFNCKDDALMEILLDIIDTPISPELLPSDGKKVVQKTEITVGPYEVIDFCIYYFLRNGFSKEKIYFLAKQAFKDLYTEEELAKYYNGFINRFFHNQFKRNAVPDGPKVGSVSVSPRGDLRMPSEADSAIWLLDLLS